MANSSSLVAVLALGTLWSLAAAPRPADARRPPVPDVRGSYFGNFVAGNSDTWPGEVTLFLQTGSRLGGELRIGARVTNVNLTGTVASSGRIRLDGNSGTGRNRLHFRLTGTFQEMSGASPRFDGSYRITGARSESGSFQMIGNTD